MRQPSQVSDPAIYVPHLPLPRMPNTPSEQMRQLQRESHTGHDFHIFWVPGARKYPRRSSRKAGVLGDCHHLGPAPLLFPPLERDVLSLELDDSFRDLYLAKDPTPTFLLARALVEIQQKHGLFPRIVGKGDNAKGVAELLSRMRQELLAGEDAHEADKVGMSPSTTNESLIISTARSTL